MKLRPVKGRPAWCGPSAVSALTGRSTDCVAAWINAAARGRPHTAAVKGTRPVELDVALSNLGYSIAPAKLKVPARTIYGTRTVRPTFAQFLRLRDKAKSYLVLAGGHWMAVRGHRVVCSLNPDGVPTSKAPNRRALVRVAWIIEPHPGQEATRRRAMRREPMPGEVKMMSYTASLSMEWLR